MQTHDLIQGSPEWKAYRATHFNASDAPAMMGVSPYKTRSALLHEMHTGLTAEIDAATQRRFDDGHRYEALARPLAEKIIGQDLYPVVGSAGKLSASFDGLTLAEDIGFEHKTLNDELRAAMVDGCTGADLPMLYQVQMEQQCMVSGAKTILFMASKWNGDELEEERHCWYTRNPNLAIKIVDGWDQFEADLAAYVPPEVKVEAVGRTPESLPALRIEVTGLVTASNLGTFREHAVAVIGSINRELQTDQDFADAEKAVKWCGEVEDRLKAAKQHALSQTESIDLLFRTIDEISAEARSTRLELDRLVKARKEQIRAEILKEGVDGLSAHVAGLNQRLGKPYMPAVPADFAGAMKGKKTVSSLRDAVSTTLANAKIEANAIADRIQLNLKAIHALKDDDLFKHNRAELPGLFADLPQLVLKAPEDCAAVIANRVAGERQRVEAERERIAEEERVKAEAKVREEQEAAARAAVQPVAAPVAQVSTPQPAVQSIAARTSSLRLGQINERLGLTVTADFLTSLGFAPASVEKNAKLYHDADFPRICAAIAQHVTAAGSRFTTPLAA